jgi:tyrosyl-tRNA synthetase
MKQDIIAELQWRGLVYQTTDDEHLPAWLNEEPRVVYGGFDPTSESLHVGNLMPLMMLRRFQNAGHRVIALIGGATGMIGDPSGKSSERNLLDEDQLQRNVDGVEKQIRQVLAGGNGPPAIVVNNYDWIRRFGYIEFLRDVGKNVPVNVMMAKESVKNRLEGDSGISYTEFSYMLLQAYDFVHLYREYGCRMQIGGSDQWGNITAGTDLGRRMGAGQLYGLTHPLLTKTDGSKMGKTESGAVWLSGDRTSPYHFYQYWINVDDEDAGRCLRFLTEVDESEVAALDDSRALEPHRKDSQRRLAEELTRLIHGEDGLATAARATEILFGAEISDLSDADLGNIFNDVPSAEIGGDQLQGEGLSLIDAFVIAGLSKSKGEARRTQAQGGAYVNNRRIEDPDYRLTPGDLASESIIVLRSGKKKKALLKIAGA